MSTNLNICELLKANSALSLVDIVSSVENNHIRVNVVIIISKITAIARRLISNFKIMFIGNKSFFFYKKRFIQLILINIIL